MSLFQPDPSTLQTLKSTPKTILITGGASGIGLATASLLSSLNPSHNLILLDLQPPPPSFSHSPSNTLFQQCDITSWESQRSAFEAAYARFGRIDAVFVNAGIAEYKDQFFTDELDEQGKLKEPDRRVLRVDMDAASDTTKLAIHYLRKNSTGGSVVMTASLAGYLASAGAPLYSAAKHGIVGLMRALKGETSKVGIAVSVIAPGITVTPILITGNAKPEKHDPEDYAKDMASAGVPINRVESVALAVCWLLNEESKANGAGIFIQNNKFWDFERALAKSRSAWMNAELLNEFRTGRNASIFKRIPETTPSKSKI